MSRKNDSFFQVLESMFNADKIIDFMDSFIDQTVKKNSADT